MRLHQHRQEKPPNTNKDKDQADVDEEASSEEEEEVRASTLDFLKSRFSGKGQAKTKAAPVKAKAGAKAGPKAGAAKPTSKTDLSKSKTGNGTARRSTLESITEVPPDVNSNADKELVDSFAQRLEVLGCLEPPLADGPFKQYLTDKLQELSAYGSEMHLKTKSVGRRLNFAEDPLSVAFLKLKEQKAEIQNFVKCNSMVQV